MGFGLSDNQSVKAKVIIKEIPVERIVIQEKMVEVEVPVYINVQPKKHGVAETNRRLRKHPNFKLPDREPDLENVIDLSDYIIESICMFISPPKVDGEDENFSCEDVAQAIKSHLQPEIIERLKQVYSKGLFKPQKRKIEL